MLRRNSKPNLSTPVHGMAATAHRITNKRIWDQRDLERRLCHALTIAQQAVERLAVNGYTDKEEPANNLRPEKVITETALLLYVASRAAHLAEVNARIRAVADLLLPRARSQLMLLGVCLEPSLGWDYAQAHVLLSKLGYADPHFDHVLEQSNNSQARAGHERTPYRALEQQWIKTLWNHSTTNGKRQALTARASVIGKSLDLLSGTREDIYAFTHALMYVTNFGSMRKLPQSRAVILAQAEAALAFCLDEQDYDLGGEVLLAWPLTGKSWSAAASFGFRVLASVEDKAGFLPTAGTRLDRLNKLEGDARSEYLLATAYHTVYVMGLLCALALAGESFPPVSIPARNAVPGSAEKILTFIDVKGTQAHWHDEFQNLSARERDAIAGLLLSMALRQKTKARDFGAIHQLLSVAYSLNLAGHPACSQAAEMLGTIAKFAERAKAKAP